MAEMILMKTIKGIIAFFCYFGTGIIAIDQVLEGAIKEALSINPAAQQIILCLLIIFWIVKIFWFVYEKFYLETKERKLSMQHKREEIQDLIDGHKKKSQPQQLTP